MSTVTHFRVALLLAVTGFLFLCSIAAAETVSYTTIDTPRFILYIGEPKQQVPEQSINQQAIANIALGLLDSIDGEVTRIFHSRPEKKVVLRFLSPDDFREQTGAPEWTSAMYLRDEITIPLTEQTLTNVAELTRALRHEYVHAVIAQLSNYKCPAWLDEGIAQLIEGQPNPLLGPALRDWIKANDAMPLEWLKNGFTTLENSFVPAAYAESLFIARRLVHSVGFGGILAYLAALKDGKAEETAFEMAFNKNQLRFERSLTGQLRLWSQSTQIDP